MSDLTKRYVFEEDQDALAEGLKDTKGEGRREIDLEAVKAHLLSRVKGQDHVIEPLVAGIRETWWQKKRSQPVAFVVFAGPTGTGKTETAKALTEALYEDERNMLVFDCTTFKGAESVTQLIGSPPGYQGHEKGGALTGAMIANRKQVVVFDEIDKADKAVYDLFMSIADEGRLQAANGRTADFTDAIVILTMNREHEKIGELQTRISDPDELTSAIAAHLAEAGVFRPEMLARFTKIYAFKPLPREVLGDIVLLKVVELADSYGLELDRMRGQIVLDLVERSQKVKNLGTRGLKKVVRETFAGLMVDAAERGATRIRLVLDDDGKPVVEPVDPQGGGKAKAMGARSPALGSNRSAERSRNGDDI